MSDETKQCKKCGEWKILGAFYKRADGKSMSPCKECRRLHSQLPHIKQRKSEYYKRPEYKKKKRGYQLSPEVQLRRKLHNQKPEVKARRAQKQYEYCQRPEIKIRHSEQQRRYHQKTGIKKARSDKGKEYRKSTRVKGMLKVNDQNRRSRERQLPNTLTQAEWQHALNYFNGCCAICGRQLNDMFGEFTAAADHYIPVAYEGDDNPGTTKFNIIPLCHGLNSCNNSKGSTMPDIWLERKFGKRKANKILKRIQAYFDSLQ